MSIRRRLFLSLLFSSRASAVVFSTAESGAAIAAPFVRMRVASVVSRPGQREAAFTRIPEVFPPGSALGVDRSTHALYGDAQVLLGDRAVVERAPDRRAQQA